MSSPYFFTYLLQGDAPPLKFLQVFYMDQIKYISLNKLNPPDFDARVTTSPDDDSELMESIKEHGVLEPLIVRNTEKGYEIIAGKRRFIEAGNAGLSSVPCIIKKSTDSDADIIKLHENIKRLPMSHIDQGMTFKHLIDKYNMTETTVASLVGKSTGYISQHLSLLESDESLIDSVREGRLNFSVARELMHLKDKDELKRMQDICEHDGAGAAIVHNWVHESNRETLKPDNPKITYEPVPDRAQYREPSFPCQTCENKIPIKYLKVLRICPDCFHLIFSAFDAEKQKLTDKTAKGSSEPT